LPAVPCSSLARPNLRRPSRNSAALDLTLPAVPAVIANYVPAVRSGNLVFLAGQIARSSDGKFVAGKVGRELTEAQGADMARVCALQLIAVLKAEVGDLAKVKRIVKVTGFVNCTDDFTTQPKVINGASDLFVAVFGETGRHAARPSAYRRCRQALPWRSSWWRNRRALILPHDRAGALHGWKNWAGTKTWLLTDRGPKPARRR